MRYGWALVLVLAMMITYQNCGSVNVAKAPDSAQVASKNLDKTTQSMCAAKGVTFGASMRVVFIIDMSMSNVGSLNYISIGDSGTIFSIDKTDGPTDLAGNRFKQVKDFIENCGGSANISYSIIGFGNGTLFTNGNTCYSPFESQAEALISINGLKGMQDHDLAVPYGYGTSPYYLEGQTSYSAGLGCLKSKITEDLTLLVNDKPIYNVYFLTDGQTTDVSPNYAQLLTDIQLSVRNSATAFNFYPVYYTSPGAKNADATAKASAMATLSAMAKVVDPNASALLIEDINSTQNKLCQFVKPEATVSYELKSVYAVNLTTLRQGQSLKADSDMDGVSDEEEIQMGWDPLNPWSSSINDRICYLMGKDKNSCQTALSKLKCTQDLVSPNLTDCDRKMAAKYFGVKLTGVDTDHDMIPDFIELGRQMSPARNDGLDNPSGDGVTNFEKVTWGLDVWSNTNEVPVPKSEYVDISFHELGATCSEGRKQYEYVLNNIPLTEVLAYQDSKPGFMDLSHGKDENVVIVVSYWQSNGGINLPDKVYLQKVTAPLHEKKATVGDMIYLGER